MQRDKIGFAASEAPEAKSAHKRLAKRYSHVPPEEADVIVSLGGDGMMLQTLHRFGSGGKLIYGMNRGSVGFLTNEYHENGLLERLHGAEVSTIHPLKMEATTKEGATIKSIAFNEVSLLRQIHQAAKLRISIDEKVRLEELICDGALVSTPAGSTAYNLSAHGPILPIDSPLLALTPISAFRPRRWRGAILPRSAKVLIEVLEPEKRPVAAVADHVEARNVVSVRVTEDRKRPAKLLFDNGHNLAERVLVEQFRF